MTGPIYDITIWEEIRTSVERKIHQLVDLIKNEIRNDRSIAEFQGTQPVPWQLREIMQQRGSAWVQRVYDLCSDSYRNHGKEPSSQFDRAVWAYCIEPFVMDGKEIEILGYEGSGVLQLLLCAVGSPPEKRNSLKVSQKDCCIAVRLKLWEIWRDRLLRLPSKIDQAVAAMSRFNAVQARAANVARGLAVHSPTPVRGSQEFISAPLPVQPPEADSPAPEITKVQLDAKAAADEETLFLSDKGARIPMPGPVLPQALVPGSQELVSAPAPVQPIEADAPRKIAKPKSEPDAAQWEDVQILFLSDERVQIFFGKSHHTRNYAEFGFGDTRTNNPKQAWQTLRKLAQAGGVLRNGTEAGLRWSKVEKRIQEIRRVFRKHFGIDSDPLPFVENLGYRARFKITCGPSFRT